MRIVEAAALCLSAITFLALVGAVVFSIAQARGLTGLWITDLFEPLLLIVALGSIAFANGLGVYARIAGRTQRDELRIVNRLLLGGVILGLVVFALPLSQPQPTGCLDICPGFTGLGGALLLLLVLPYALVLPISLAGAVCLTVCWQQLESWRGGSNRRTASK